MAIYVVMESGRMEADGSRRTAYVRDGFSLIGLLFPAFWLLWHRLWIEALLVLALGLCLAAFGSAIGVTAGAVMLLSLLAGLYVGLEGGALRLAAFRRRGWREWGIVRADGRDDAETRYLLEAVDGGEHAPADLRPAGEAPRRQTLRTGPAMGLLGYPEGR